jgi:8-oxo-dGTP diphosphatase
MLEVVCGIIRREDGTVLVAQRPVGKHLAGKWEFPGGKLEMGESQEEALQRELHEELGCRVTLVEALQCSQHTYKDGVSIKMFPMICEVVKGTVMPRALEHAEIHWVMVDKIGAYDLAAADVPVWEELVRWNKKRFSVSSGLT